MSEGPRLNADLMFEDVFKEMPEHLQKQRALMRAERGGGGGKLTPMANMNMIQALNSAMDIMLEQDPSVVLMGEDIGYFGGVFRATEGLQRKYGEHRVLDTPIAEGGIIAAAIGMSVNGLRPVAEIQFADYIYPGFDQIVQRAGAHPLSQRRRVLRARDHSHALRRRHPRRPDAFAKSRRHFHACQRHQSGHAVESLRCQGPADHLHRGR